MARTETVTVLFTDLVGSTELADGLGHAAYEKLRSAHFDALRSDCFSSSEDDCFRLS